MPTTVVGGQTITWTLTSSAAQQAGSRALNAFVAENGGTVNVLYTPPAATNQIAGNIFNIPGGDNYQISVNDEAIITSTPTSATLIAIGDGDLLIHDPPLSEPGKSSQLFAFGNNDSIVAADRTDLIQMVGSGESVWAGDGLDTILISGSGSVIAGSGNDYISIGSGDITVGDGYDIIRVAGNGSVVAGNGNLDIAIGSGSVQVGDGYDVINVTGAGSVVAGNGNLSITMGSGSVRVGDGYDVINVAGAGSVVAGNGNLDIVIGSGSIHVGDGSSDLVVGGTGSVTAGDGNNFISLGSGSVQSGDGYDTILLTGSGNNDTVTLGSNTDMVTEAGTSTAFISGPGGIAASIAGGETLTLAKDHGWHGWGKGFRWSHHSDTHITLSGTGNATVQAGSGVERITAGAGADTIFSGGTADVFEFWKGTGGTHVINNFREGTDRLDLDGGYNINNVVNDGAKTFSGGSETLNLSDGTKITINGLKQALTKFNISG
jgi:hypothetical protein